MSRHYASVNDAVIARTGRIGRSGLWASGVLAFILASPAHAQAMPAPEYEAAVRRIVLGIISYTNWPEPRANVRLCVTGRTHFALDLPGEAPPLAELRVVQQEMPPDVRAIGSACDALYMGELSSDERGQINAHVAGHPVLTISEHDSTCTQGAMFCLNNDAGRVTFDINLDSVARSGVRVSPNVLRLAHKQGAS
jgi:YfiR/HmsC-like